jgi:hypothetical protein
MSHGTESGLIQPTATTGSTDSTCLEQAVRPLRTFARIVSARLLSPRPVAFIPELQGRHRGVALAAATSTST